GTLCAAAPPGRRRPVRHQAKPPRAPGRCAHRPATRPPPTAAWAGQPDGDIAWADRAGRRAGPRRRRAQWQSGNQSWPGDFIIFGLMSDSSLLDAVPRVPATAATLSALKPGARYAQPRPPGSADAWLLADLARQAARPLVVLTAAPLEAQRLADEIPQFAPDLRVRQLPDWETLPYDAFSPHQDLVSQRLHTLHALMQRTVDVLLVPVTTALYRLAPPSFLAAYTFSFKQKDRLDEAALRAQLTLANYTHVTQVTAPGEFCLRGGLIDLFPMGSAVPYRLDLFDDEIESIRSFDVDTQRSLYPVREVQLLPGREFPMDEAARNRFRARFREEFEGDPSRALPYKDIGNGIAFAGV